MWQVVNVKDATSLLQITQILEVTDIETKDKCCINYRMSGVVVQ